MIVLIVDGDAARRSRCVVHVAALGHVARTSGEADGDVEAAIVDAGLLEAQPTLLGDIRRAAPEARLLLIVGPASVDAAARGLGLDNLDFLPEAPARDAIAAMLPDKARPASSLKEESAGYALRLAALGEEIARIARAIEPPPPLADAPAVPDAPIAFDPKLVRAVLRDRRRRDALFADGTFADPVWDMLLDLTAARGEGVAVSVSSLAIAAAVPATTALRHLKAMADAGLVVRRPDPEDGRRINIDLSDDAFARMRAWVAGLGKAV